MSENRNHERHVLLITGTPGIGKTTVIRRTAEWLGLKGLRGFYTKKIREDGERRGFRLMSFDGTARIIAHVDFPSATASANTGLTSQCWTRRPGCLAPILMLASISWTKSAKWNAFRIASLLPCAS